MTPREEQVYLQGQRSVWFQLLSFALRGLSASGSSGPAISAARLVKEREDLIAVIRRRYPDLVWSDPEEYLPDVLERVLDEAQR